MSNKRITFLYVCRFRFFWRFDSLLSLVLRSSNWWRRVNRPSNFLDSSKSSFEKKTKNLIEIRINVKKKNAFIWERIAKDDSHNLQMSYTDPSFCQYEFSWLAEIARSFQSCTYQKAQFVQLWLEEFSNWNKKKMRNCHIHWPFCFLVMFIVMMFSTFLAQSTHRVSLWSSNLLIGNK
jgi:hypothetical protein